MQTIDEQFIVEATAPDNRVYGKRWQRFLALLLDGFLVMLCFFLSNTVIISYVFTIVVIIFVFIYRPVSECIWHTTLGKWMFRLKVARPDATRVHVGHVLVRHALYIGCLLFLYYISYLLERKIMSGEMQRHSSGTHPVLNLAILFSLFVFLFDAIWIFFGSKNQTLHDRMAGTVVVKDQLTEI